MAELDDYFVKPASSTIYDFTNVRPRTSMWFETNGQRVNATKAFKRWKDETGSPITATTAKVGNKDPRGEGFRMFFDVENIVLKPAIAEVVFFFDKLSEFERFAYEWNGIFSNDDIREALQLEGINPRTIAEAKAFRRSLWQGTARYCADYCAAEGKENYKTWKEGGEEARAAAMQPVEHHKVEKPEPQRGRPNIPWSSLTEDTQHKLTRQGIADEAAFVEAFMACPAGMSEQDAVYALAHGYAPYCRWLQYLNGRTGTEFLNDEGDEE